MVKLCNRYWRFKTSVWAVALAFAFIATVVGLICLLLLTESKPNNHILHIPACTNSIFTYRVYYDIPSLCNHVSNGKYCEPQAALSAWHTVTYPNFFFQDFHGPKPITWAKRSAVSATACASMSSRHLAGGIYGGEPLNLRRTLRQLIRHTWANEPDFEMSEALPRDTWVCCLSADNPESERQEALRHRLPTCLCAFPISPIFLLPAWARLLYIIISHSTCAINSALTGDV